jgi:hypothetical protein
MFASAKKDNISATELQCLEEILIQLKMLQHARSVPFKENFR